MNSDRIVTNDNDSIFVTKDDNGRVWLAVFDDSSGRAVEIELNDDASAALREALENAN